MAKLVINRRVTTVNNRQRLQAWVAETSENIPAAVFVYQRLPVVPLVQASTGYFVHIASYADLTEFPPHAAGTKSPFYRLYYIDLIFDSLAVLEEKWTMIRRQLKVLLEDLVRINDFSKAEFEEVQIK